MCVVPSEIDITQLHRFLEGWRWGVRVRDRDVKQDGGFVQLARECNRYREYREYRGESSSRL